MVLLCKCLQYQQRRTDFHMSKQCLNTYQFISQAYNLLSSCPNESTDLINALKIKTQKIQTTTKTVLPQGKGTYNKVITQHKLTTLQVESTEVIKAHSRKLFEQLFRNRVKSISERIQLLLDLDKSVSESDSKFIIFGVLEELDSEYEDLVGELSEAKKYGKNRQFRDILNLEILNPSVELYMEEMFIFLPNLKLFFQQFPYKKLTIEEIHQLTIYKTSGPSIQINLEELIEIRRKKNLKKKNKKKQLKSKTMEAQTQTKSSQTQEIIEPCDESEGVINFLRETVIKKDRQECYISQDWVESLKQRYLDQ